MWGLVAAVAVVSAVRTVNGAIAVASNSSVHRILLSVCGSFLGFRITGMDCGQVMVELRRYCGGRYCRDSTANRRSFHHAGAS